MSAQRQSPTCDYLVRLRWYTCWWQCCPSTWTCSQNGTLWDVRLLHYSVWWGL